MYFDRSVSVDFKHIWNDENDNIVAKYVEFFFLLRAEGSWATARLYVVWLRIWLYLFQRESYSRLVPVSLQRYSLRPGELVS